MQRSDRLVSWRRRLVDVLQHAPHRLIGERSHVIIVERQDVGDR